MEFIQKYRLWIAGVVVVVAGFFLLSWGWEEFKPVPEMSQFRTRYFSFEYPRIYSSEEYARGVVSIGTKDGEGLDPLIEVTRYRSDPDVAAPKTFDAFMKLQAGALCGADGPIESIVCTEVGVAAYTSPRGVAGQQLNLTLVRKNLKSGTTTDQAYGPIYVFNTTDVTASSTPDNPFRYSAIFIYPSLAAFINQGTTSPELMQQVISTFTIPTTTSAE